MAIRNALVSLTTEKVCSEAREVVRGGPGYPAALAGIAFEPAAPERLWLRGELPQGRMVAVVGARAARAGALVAARAVAAGLAGAEITVVSGGAIGIDGAAHRGALDAGGRTVVVLGTGIDVPYPLRHASLFEEVLARGGALLTPAPPGTAPSRWSFPRRNAIVAALAETVVVVEAGAASGSLHTAAAARQLGRRVIALLGSPGCDLLVARGAEPARSADEILQWVVAASAAEMAAAGGDGGSPFVAPPPLDPLLPTLPEDPRARRLYEALDATPRDLGEVAARAGLPASEALALAIDLELGGLAARAAGGRYLRLG